MDFDTRHLRAFVALAADLHFTTAARRLYLTQPTLSKYIRRVEEQVGCALFERTTREVRLTRQGREFLVHARRIVDALDGVGRPDSAVRLASLGRVGLPAELVTRLRAADGDADVSVDLMDTAAQLDAVRRGELTAAWVHLSAPPADDLDYLLIRLEAMILACPQSDTVPVPEPPTAVALHLSERDAAEPWVSFVRDFALEVGLELKAADRAIRETSIATDIALAPTADPVPAPASIAAGLVAGGAGVYGVMPIQPYYAWSLVWRADPVRPPVLAGLLDTARRLAAECSWLDADPALPGEPWLPAGDPHHPLTARIRTRWRTARTTATESRLPVIRLDG